MFFFVLALMDRSPLSTYNRFQHLFNVLSNFYNQKKVDQLKEYLNPLLRNLYYTHESPIINESIEFYLQCCNRILDVAFWLLNTWFTRPKDETDSFHALYFESFWIGLMSHRSFVFEGDDISINTNNYVRRMFQQANSFERELAFRHKIFEQTFGTRKTYEQLYKEYNKICINYLEACTHFHSRVQIEGLQNLHGDKMEDFFENMIGKPINCNIRPILQELLHKIEMPSQQYQKMLKSVDLRSTPTANTEKKTFSNFIPSIPETNITQKFINERTKSIASILQDHRWIVVLGEPRCGKTSFLRWLMHRYARTCQNGASRVMLNRADYIKKDDEYSDEETELSNDGDQVSDENEEIEEMDTVENDDFDEVEYQINAVENNDEIDIGPTRLPILIRIEEVVEWLKQEPHAENEELTLFDFIGKQTWMDKSYTENDCSKNMLHDFILHGHALILIDGLDEVSSHFSMRQRIVAMIEKFISEYVRTPEHFSIGDDFETCGWWSGLNICHLSTDRPAYHGGNQVIITTRITGYEICELQKWFFIHFRFKTMEVDEVKAFIQDWLHSVSNSIKSTLHTTGIDDESLKNIDAYVEKARLVMIKELIEDEINSRIWHHQMLLMLVCSALFSSALVFSKKRIFLYASVINSCMHLPSSISIKTLTTIFEDLATYLQFHSASGLIDTNELQRLIRRTLLSINEYRPNMEKEVFSSIFREKGNDAIIVARGLDAYGFMHKLFQEYFCATTLVRMASTNMTLLCAKTIANRLMRYGMQSHHRQSIFLALSWLSLNLNKHKFDLFCSELASRNFGGMPIGALLLMETITDMYSLPSNEILFSVLDILFAVEHETHFDGYVVRAFNHMEERVVIELITEYVKVESRIDRFCLFLHKVFKIYADSLLSDNEFLWISSSICHSLWASQNNFAKHQINFDLTLWITSLHLFNTAIHRNISDINLQNFLIRERIHCDHVHPHILAVIIALYGGLNISSRNKDFYVEFSSQQIHRPSDGLLAKSIISYFEDNTSDHATKLTHLISFCEEQIRAHPSTETSSWMVDFFTALVCLRGVHQSNIYEEFKCYSALSLSLERYKQILINLRQTYGDTDDSVYLDGNFILKQILTYSHTDSTSLIEAITIALARLSTREKPTCLQNLIVPKASYCSRLVPLFSPTIYNPADEKKENLTIDQMTHPYQSYSNNVFFYLTFLPHPLKHIYEQLILTDRLNVVRETLLLIELLLYVDANKERPPRQRLILLLQVLDPIFSEFHLDGFSLGILYEVYCSDRTKLSNSSLRNFIEHKCGDIKDREIFKTLIPNLKSSVVIPLITSCVSLARLIVTFLPSNYLNLIDEIFNSISTLHDPFIKLLILYSLLQILNRHLDKSQYDRVLIEVVNATEYCFNESSNISLLEHTLVFICSASTCRLMRSNLYEKYLENIVSQLNKPFHNEAYARDQEIAYISLQHLFSFELPNIFLSRSNLGEFLNLKSKAFYNYFDKSIPTVSTLSQKTLLSAMYLSELAIDIRILETFYTTTETNIHFDQMRISLKKAQPLLTHEVSLLTDKFLQSNITPSILFEIELILRQFTKFEFASRYILEKWLNEYRCDEEKCAFAHIATVLLLEQGVASVLSIEILCKDILPHDIDWIQIRARTCLNNIKYGMPWSHLLCSTLLKYAYRHAQLSLYHEKDIEEIISLEKSRTTSLSYFLLIHFCSDNVKCYIENSILLLNHNSERFLIDVLFYLGHFVTKSDQWLHNLDRIFDNSTSIDLKIAIIHNFGLYKEGRNRIIKFITMYATGDTLHEDVLIKCLKELYRNPGDEEEFQQIDKTLWNLWTLFSSSASSNSIVLHAGACYLFYRCKIQTNIDDLLKCLESDVSTLYDIIMLNERAHLWANRLLYRYENELMAKFLSDIVNMANNRKQDKSLDILLLAADWMVRNDNTKFCRLVHCLNNEPGFKSAIYRLCTERDSPLETVSCPSHLTSEMTYYRVSWFCLRIYSAFGELTQEWIQIFLIHIRNYDKYSLEHSINCIKDIKRVADRDLIECLFLYLKSASVRCRYLIAYLLLHLASLDILSFVEVYDLLGKAIIDLKSRQPFQGQNEKRQTLSEEIRYLLLNQSCIEIIEQDNRSLVSSDEIEVDYLRALDAPLFVACLATDS